VTVGASKFTVAAASGNTAIAGTLSVTGTSSHTGNSTFGGTITVSGASALQGGATVTGGALTLGSATTAPVHIVTVQQTAPTMTNGASVVCTLTFGTDTEGLIQGVTSSTGNPGKNGAICQLNFNSAFAN